MKPLVQSKDGKYYCGDQEMVPCKFILGGKVIATGYTKKPVEPTKGSLVANKSR